MAEIFIFFCYLQMCHVMGNPTFGGDANNEVPDRAVHPHSPFKVFAIRLQNQWMLQNILYIATDKRDIHILFFLFLNKNICCGYSLEAPRGGASNEYRQNMFLLRNKKIYQFFCLKKNQKKTRLIWSNDYGIYRLYSKAPY